MDSARGYNLLASFYDALSWIVFGRSMHDAQSEYLEDIPTRAKILVLGGGTGQWLKHPWLQNANHNITYIDLSPAMLKRAKRNGGTLNISFVEGTQDVLNGGENYDAVILFCYLDLFNNDTLPEVVGKISRSVRPGAMWLVVDFVNLKWWHSALLSVMHIFFKVFTGLNNNRLPEWQKILEQNGIREKKFRGFYGNFIRTSSLVSSL